MADGMLAQMEELFAVVEGVSIRRMFGGLGMFRDGLMFALVADDVLYMKADETSAAAYEAEGCGQWIYDGRDRPVPMPYWRVPERLYDEPEEFRDWALAAFAVAARTAKPKKSTANKRPSLKPPVKAGAAETSPARGGAAKKIRAKKPAAKPPKNASAKKRATRRSPSAGKAAKRKARG